MPIQLGELELSSSDLRSPYAFTTTFSTPPSPTISLIATASSSSSSLYQIAAAIDFARFVQSASKCIDKILVGFEVYFKSLYIIDLIVKSTQERKLYTAREY
ncbi:hypothetical protein TWF506_004832 [Arthrobotrys conoides]|uniref:Uncharacterized protein n=1 Tax=Arthrobotrys conoides TaxID=74498 RepID=A0AAN8RPG8_9PEZI